MRRQALVYLWQTRSKLSSIFYIFSLRQLKSLHGSQVGVRFSIADNVNCRSNMKTQFELTFDSLNKQNKRQCEIGLKSIGSEKIELALMKLVPKVNMLIG